MTLKDLDILSRFYFEGYPQMQCRNQEATVRYILKISLTYRGGSLILGPRKKQGPKGTFFHPPF